MNSVRLSLSLGAALAVAGQARAEMAPSVPGEFVVKISRGARSEVASHFKKAGIVLEQEISQDQNMFLARVPNAQATVMKSGSSRLSAASLGNLDAEALRSAVQRAIASIPQVEYAEPNYIYKTFDEHAMLVANDPKGNSQWGLKKIQAAEAWETTTGSNKVTVAVVDTGIDYTHPDLAGNMWTKPGTSDVHGYNAVTGREDPMDDGMVAHGTHCAGVIGAVGNNSVGITGVNWNVSLMGSKFLSRNGSGSTVGAVKAIDYAVNNGAQVISASWGGGPYSRAILDAISRANDKGIVFVAAAGNDGKNNDRSPTYPASYQLPNIVAVAATDRNDAKASYSNYGANSVLLAAPGSEIFSTVSNNGYVELDGTSMATPHVTGAVALLLSVEPSLSPTEIVERLTQAVDKLPGLVGQVKTAGRLNLAKLFSQN